jgi:Peptidase inhibitor family I36
MPRFLALLTVLLLAASPPAGPLSALQSPNPNGCYVYVYENAEFAGARYVFNGPARFRTLKRTLSEGELSWDNRIRSLRVGEAATVTVFTETSFAGRSTRFTAGTAHPRLEPAFAGHIQSAVLECSQTSRSIRPGSSGWRSTG